MRSENIKESIPVFLRNADVYNVFYDSLGQQMDYIYQAMEDVQNQLNVTTATWGLKCWEELLGVEVNLAKSYAFRRSVILSKLRGVGTVTKALIQSSSQSFENGSLFVEEVPDEYKLILRFTELNGVPPNFDDYEMFIRDIIPAHLGYEFVIKYVLNRELNHLSNDHLHGHTYDQLKVLDYV